ncbi:hypothetical protein SEA_PHILONIUS_49 [Mycobacterium phage Philonius]|uniref:Uncharacterized protein n=3 Tax=Caudoviricetes TaxID=2731619 RepID=A0A2H4PD15_9CAUD|nr:hypothetical protein I5J38_gp46 [Mycobacterium phage Willsammy]YP_010001348.1 hypothetical protein J1N47_gp47 [Mycobacterium phage KilKor]YP_010051913.1 hypothetical protein KD928_gp49 [Mycobacterium phage Philonius]QHB41314.1 hypothetical protein SEA_PHALM_47 [Mycobacterium phage Phalm]QHB41471.1 hypothetical protein SEA_GLASKE_47 [Mycobacterium phage Glaske]QHJ86305.1 hypothetical protein SEA_CACTUSJACK_47 [Mycobacterium phage CactusJack]ATW60108.1 hypothetical protein SEA_PHILONIUS_49 [
MSAPDRAAVVELVTNAIGYGVMMATEGRDKLRERLQSAPPNTSLADVVRAEAEQFVNIRADLVAALGGDA